MDECVNLVIEGGECWCRKRKEYVGEADKYSTECPKQFSCDDCEM